MKIEPEKANLSSRQTVQKRKGGSVGGCAMERTTNVPECECVSARARTNCTRKVGDKITEYTEPSHLVGDENR